MITITVATVKKITLKDSDVNEVYAVQCYNQKNPNQMSNSFEH